MLHAAEVQSLIDVIFKGAGYTYGPLLGLFTVGIFTKLTLPSKHIWLAIVLAMTCTGALDRFSVEWFSGYKIGVELIVINAMLFIGIVFVLSRARKAPHKSTL
jgi:L-asparagine transporter-like permease